MARLGSSSLMVFILVMGSLAFLLYTSQFIAQKNSDEFYSLLGTKKVSGVISRLKESPAGGSYFVLGDPQLAKHGFVTELTNQADYAAETDRTEYGDRYAGYFVQLNATEAIPLVKEFAGYWNHTVVHEIVRDSRYQDEVYTFASSFQRGGKYYYLSLEFRSLTALGKYGGFVPANITSSGMEVAINSYGPGSGLEEVPAAASHAVVVNPSNVTVFYTFNNTAVWTNRLDSDQWARLTLTTTKRDGGKYTVTGTIPPGRSWDYRLNPDFSSAAPTDYHYRLDIGSKSFEGDYFTKFYPRCMTQAEARSLYLQNGFVVRFPSYMPDGYSYVCGIHYDGFMLMQAYWDRPKDSVKEEDFEGSYSLGDRGLKAGIIQVFALAQAGTFHSEANNTAFERLKQIPATRPGQFSVFIEPRIAEIGPSATAITYQRNLYPDGTFNILEVYDGAKNEEYVLRGMVPQEELIKMAESMY